jgi:hypothetical protein
MLRQDAEFALDAGSIDLFDVAGEQLAHGRNQREMQQVSHDGFLFRAPV